MFELSGGKEEVVEEPPLGGVELVEELDQPRIFEALIAQPLADMSPVFLFDMSVVVLLVRPRAGELDRGAAILEVADEVPLKELGAVIAVEAENGKGQRGFDGNDLFQYAPRTFAPDGALFSPSGGEVGEVEAEDELTGHGVAAMRHGIGLQEAGTGLVPLVGFDRDVALKECAGLGGREASALNAQALLSKQAVNRGGRDFRQACLTQTERMPKVGSDGAIQ